MPFANVGHDKIYYVSQGNSSNVTLQRLPIVFVHGAGSNHLIWGHQVHALAGVAHPVAIDLPGHGRSDPPGRTSVTAYRDVLLGLCDALGFGRVVIVGHSMGGAIAQTLALSHPDRVAGVGLVGTGARLRVLPAILDGIISPSQFESTVRLVTENSYAHLDETMRRRVEDELRACPPQVTHDDFAACNAFDIMERVGEIRAPACIVCGRQDKMTPAKYSEFLAAHLPQAQLVLIDEAGHYVMLEQPDQVSQALVDFVGTLHA
jgi:pimeloyl-ACP methyl ester carboxylesterase